MHHRCGCWWWYFSCWAIITPLLRIAVGGEHVRDLEISEAVPSGTRIGFIGDGEHSSPPYLIVPVGSAVDTDLYVDQTTGEIRTKVQLDREQRAIYSLVAIPLSGDNVRVVIHVLDENDNAPQFPSSSMAIDFPENTPRDVKRTLNPAKDPDLNAYNTQKYTILSGNTANAFKLSSHRERDGVLYLDLQINGFLDRETTDQYRLLIEAVDGGTPPLRGQMLVNVTIQDVNDNQPVFNESRYHGTIPENATVLTPVLRVFATDTDAGDNGRITYSINRRQSDRDSNFIIDPITGLISLNKELDFETKDVHELVIHATDHGLQPLETTAFVSIQVTDVNDNQPTINVIFLSEDATPRISEAAQPGDFVARISVHDPDSRTMDISKHVNVTLQGGEGHFGLTTRDNVIYLVVVSLPLDRESKPNYTLDVVATDRGNPPLHATKTIDLQVSDINDNAPQFEHTEYHASVEEVSEVGTSVLQVVASDRDEGENGLVTYTLRDPNQWFEIDARSGLVTTKTQVNCEADPVPRFVVLATDAGQPPLSATAMVLVTVHDVNDNEPIFERSFYNVSVPENELPGQCILKVSASDSDCGVNAMVNYTLGDVFDGKLPQLFHVDAATGQICIKSTLDFETRNAYEFPVIATDRGGLSTTAMIQIQLIDTNDNQPAFHPREYNVSVRENFDPSTLALPVVIVAATDPDTGKFGLVNYKIVAGNEAGVFRMDRMTGELFVSRPDLVTTRTSTFYKLNISATDGAGLRSVDNAEIYISVVKASQRPPIFEVPKYTFSIVENSKRGTVVGTVRATIRNSHSGHRGSIRYSIYSGDPDHMFRIDSITGAIQTLKKLDHEIRQSVLLNVQAASGDTSVYGYAQVVIDIEDVNDNRPQFGFTSLRIAVPENTSVGVPLYVAHATDPDSGRNGILSYRISHVADSNSQGLFQIDSRHGQLMLARHLDYESVERHSLVITATDKGVPTALSANLSILLDVQDVNDNAPLFERPEYQLRILESLPTNSQILQMHALDADTGNNARISYAIVQQKSNGDNQRSPITDNKDNIFGIHAGSGWLYIRTNLDREIMDNYRLTIRATDNGTPHLTATTQVLVTVLDANDNSPRFENADYTFYIEENLRSGSIVGTLTARDTDTGANAAVKYFLIATTNSSFQIQSHTGVITTLEPLDRENKAEYELIAEARDQGAPPRTTRTKVTIHVLDVNDNAPEIVDPQEDVVSVREAQPIGTEVVRVRAVDPDAGTNASISYSIVKSESDGYQFFSIDPLSGVVRTKSVLDHDDRTIYRLTISATDAGSPSPKTSSRLFRVEVLDINDNRPTFTSSSLTFSIAENAMIGQQVGSISIANLHALNPSHHHLAYTLSSLMGENIPNPFEVDRISGQLVVCRQLDYETQTEYRIEVRSLDTSAPSNPQSSATTIRVHVTDVNDNQPHWPTDIVTLTVPEDTPPASVIHNFTATDRDSGANGQIRYALVTQYPSAAFSIDSLTGALTLISELDFEDVAQYIIVVQASDQPANLQQRLTSTLTVEILVQDRNDNPPVFIVPPANLANIFVDEAHLVVGMQVARIMASDKENNKITYTLANSHDAQFFALNYESGVITLSKPLPSSQFEFVLNVSANDHGHPHSLHTHQSLKLTLQSKTYNTVGFSAPIYKASITEDAPSHTFVAKVDFNAQNANTTFFLPEDMTYDAFSIDVKSGVIKSLRPLDREQHSSYTFPVYAIGRNAETLDICTVHISIIDVNDHAPEFKQHNVRLSVPENLAFAVIHTVVAHDLDSGANADISYSISDGNVDNRFSIDTKTGDISAIALDREQQSRYHLTITAQDNGRPKSMSSHCNISVMVADQNDNTPTFDMPKYEITIPEDTGIDTSIIKVHASDPDSGPNGRVIYSLANESYSLFVINNKTGVITTAGLLDREKQHIFHFHIVASDLGKTMARFQTVNCTVIVADINDNKPIFTQYPYTQRVSPYTPPGQTILRVAAHDADTGMNADIVYSLVQDLGKFRIGPNSGVITASHSLVAETGKVLYLKVQASDKGNPSQNATGLVELVVNDGGKEISPRLVFKNHTYEVSLAENSEQFRDIVQVTALRSDGRRQRIHYTFGSGNEHNTFIINAESGMIQVRDVACLDFESARRLKLVVEAHTDNGLRGFSNVLINLLDQNDNSPTFTQPQYNAAILEGDDSKGKFVVQVTAFDVDQGQNARIRYHIVDGNHDNAFQMDPPFSGNIQTNIVLDREIRDFYRLTIIATDEGIPQLTGTTRVHITVLDVNDNQPTFPPHSIITVSEQAEVGTVLSTANANDVDTEPPLLYEFSGNWNTADETFHINSLTGRITLKKPLDFERAQSYQLNIAASDGRHEAHTSLTVRVTDSNDNAPKFDQMHYQVSMPDATTSDESSASNAAHKLVHLLTLNATDEDSDENARIEYRLLGEAPTGFSIDKHEGVLRVNLSLVDKLKEDVQLTVEASDCGVPSLKSVTTIRVKSFGKPDIFNGNSRRRKDYRLQVNENTTIGSSILHITDCEITTGNELGIFEMASGSLMIVSQLDREAHTGHILHLSDDSTVTVHVLDANDNPPIFTNVTNEITVSESMPINSKIYQFHATDADEADTPNSKIEYFIVSGNDLAWFRIESTSGYLMVNGSLDFESPLGGGAFGHLVLIVKACDKALPSLCSMHKLKIQLEDENDHVPVFPVHEYLEFFGENEPIGTAVFAAYATDLDGGPFGTLNYSIMGADASLFHIDSSTGLISSNAVFDYEQRNRFVFKVHASDVGGKWSSVKVAIEVEGRDEYHPQFVERSFKFTIKSAPNNVRVGSVLGTVTATDRDKGADGRIVFQLTSQHPYFKVNRTTGAIVLKKPLGTYHNDDMSLVVSASSGKQGSLTNMTVVEIAFDALASQVDQPRDMGVSEWLLGLIIGVILLTLVFGGAFVYMHMRQRRSREGNKSHLATNRVTVVNTPANNYVDPSSFDTMPIRGNPGGNGPRNHTNGNQFAPPKYDEIPPYPPGSSNPNGNGGGVVVVGSGNGTTSELSEQSGSSGRGSAEEDGEDEEIRMINEASSTIRKGSRNRNDNDDEECDNLSNSSIRNTREYLARLGIVSKPHAAEGPQTGLSANAKTVGMLDDPHHSASLIYAQLDELDNGNIRNDDPNAVQRHHHGLYHSHTYNDVPPAKPASVSSHVRHHHHHHHLQPSMNGSLSSIVHSEEELTGSYNWDYLLDWGPQYQPLAHVFSEIARLKDDTASVKSGTSAASSAKSKNSNYTKIGANAPPPLITNVASLSRSLAMPARNSSSHQMMGMMQLPRSPIGHDLVVGSSSAFSSSAALSPSFSASLSPLAAKSPSISPLVTPAPSTKQHVMGPGGCTSSSGVAATHSKQLRSKLSTSSTDEQDSNRL